MKFRYTLSDSANLDLKAISNYWTDRADLKTARKIHVGIFEVIITLSRRPGIGIAAVDFGAGVRKFPAGSHIIYYREQGSRGIRILHVFHAARDQRSAWNSTIDKPE